MSWRGWTCCPRRPVAPESFLCEMCMEQGATKRRCCNGKFCDHCYTKNRACPRCKSATRMEKMTGATYLLPLFNENEECRICLDPGIRRRCCGNYYCDDCYFALSRCRSCDQPVDRKALGARTWGRAFVLTVLLGWAVTVFVAMLLLAVVLVVSLSELSSPLGISGFICTGFFPTCDLSVCIDTSSNVSDGLQPLQTTDQWRYCSLSSTFKVEAKACIFDPELFSVTDSVLGYDVCKSNFDGGVFNFEDTFEHWVNKSSFESNLLLSAKWSSIFNAEVGSYCGSGTEGGSEALVFYGPQARFADTQDLDLRHGGRVEADLLLAPLSFDSSHPSCRATYSGIVSVSYSGDRRSSWTTMASFQPALFRSPSFFHVQLELPQSAWSSSLRFRFSQEEFVSDRDNWAIDNVRVLSYFPSGWGSSSAFDKRNRQSQSNIQFAQCCFDTDECVRRLSDSERGNCRDLPGYTGVRYSLRQAEIWIMIVTALALIKFVYVSIQDYFIKGRVLMQINFISYVFFR